MADSDGDAAAAAAAKATADAVLDLMVGQDVRAFPLSDAPRGLASQQPGDSAAVAFSQGSKSMASAGHAAVLPSPAVAPGPSQAWSYYSQRTDRSQTRGAPTVDIGGLPAAFAGSPAQRLVGHALYGAAKSLLSPASSGRGGSQRRTEPRSITDALHLILSAPIGIGAASSGDLRRFRRTMHDDLTAVVVLLPWHLFPDPSPLLPAASFIEDELVAEVSKVMDAAAREPQAFRDTSVCEVRPASALSCLLQQPLLLGAHPVEHKGALIEYTTAAAAASVLPGASAALVRHSDPLIVATAVVSDARPQSNTLLTYFRRENSSNARPTSSVAMSAAVSDQPQVQAFQTTVQEVPPRSLGLVSALEDSSIVPPAVSAGPPVAMLLAPGSELGVAVGSVAAFPRQLQEAATSLHAVGMGSAVPSASDVALSGVPIARDTDTISQRNRSALACLLQPVDEDVEDIDDDDNGGDRGAAVLLCAPRPTSMPALSTTATNTQGLGLGGLVAGRQHVEKHRVRAAQLVQRRGGPLAALPSGSGRGVREEPFGSRSTAAQPSSKLPPVPSR